MSQRNGRFGVAQRDQLGRQRGRRERERAALAGPGDGDAASIDARQRGGRLDRPDRVEVEPAVVVGLGTRDPARHHAGMLGARGRRARVRRVSPRPRAALGPRVHDEGGEAAGGIERVARREVAPAAVADERDAAGQLGVAGGRRPQVPRLDRIAVGAAEGHVVRRHAAVGRRPRRARPAAQRSQLARGRDRRRPERVEARRLEGRRAVAAQLAQAAGRRGAAPCAVYDWIAAQHRDAHGDDARPLSCSRVSRSRMTKKAPSAASAANCEEITAATAIPCRAPSS